MEKVICVVGPTGVGKTDLALRLARIYDGELVSADAVQVFKDLDIISGKDKEEFGNTPVHLIDIVSPEDSFSVSQFEVISRKSIDLIQKNKKLPIVVGGTGFYVKALLDGVDTSVVKPDPKLRSRLESLSLEDVQIMLKELDQYTFNSMNESEQKNKRRLIRKIEILQSGIKNHNLKMKGENDLEFLQIGLELPREKLLKRIDNRVDKRINDGAIEEAKVLFKKYSNLSQQVKDANGYKQLFEHFLGNSDIENAIEKWKLSEYKHAKNQMTWFRKDTRIKWFNIENKNLFESIKGEIDAFL